jgi:Fic family protein
MNAITDFLRESNAIEGVYDDQSLKDARKAWEYLVKQKQMEIRIVLEAHRLLMAHQLISANLKGYFRLEAVYVGNHEGIDYRVIPEAMQVWCLNSWLYPKNWKAHHIRFEKIHPFIDGNGRIGRLLMNWERRKAGLPIKVIWEAKKYEYYKWFTD